MKGTISSSDVIERLGITRSTLTTYMDRGLPNNWVIKKTYDGTNQHGVYRFNKKDFELLKNIRALRLRKVSYKDIKQRLTHETTTVRLATKEEVEKLTSEIAPSEELININNKGGKLLVSSREVANNFKKSHQHILRDIKEYLDQNPKLDSEFFIESKYTNSRGQAYRKYLLNRDGFSLLVMGFTGEKALEWKLKYIEAFNKMEQELRSLTITKDSYTIDDPIERAKAWIAEEKERERLELKTKQQEQVIGELKPKSDYTDKILQTKDLVTITQIAKDYGMSGQAMNTMLNRLGVQYKESDQWLLYRDYQDSGYTHSHTVEFQYRDGSPGSKMHTKWTQKGRLFLYDLLKEEDILPLIEQDN